MNSRFRPLLPAFAGLVLGVFLEGGSNGGLLVAAVLFWRLEVK
jgi:hypothetical protein